MSVTDAVTLVALPDGVGHELLERRLPLPGSRFRDKTGEQHGVYRVVGFAGFIQHYSAWLIECKCGRQYIVRSTYFNRNCIAHCSHTENYKHDIYHIWIGMIQRCERKRCSAYKYYGARGIRVCDRWRNSFEAFLADMGERPSPRHSIDREDNNGHYEPSNCRWATKWQQARNRRNNRYITHNGVTLTHSEWADRVGLTRERIRQRANALEAIGADVSQAVSTPIGETMPAFQ